MYPIPPHEHLVETRQCRQCATDFPITDADMAFYEKVSPKFSGKISLIPPPTLCPDCRQQRRLAWRNERKLYKRKCDATGKDIISIFSPDKPYTVYHQDYWWSDAWDPMQYGREFDFTKSALVQYEYLLQRMPFPHNFLSGKNENSEYGNHSGFMKNSYLTAASWQIEDVLYSSHIVEGVACVDTLVGIRIQTCYECIKILDCHACYFTKNSSNSHNLLACSDCQGCSECIQCHGLRNKKYCIENIQLERDEYYVQKSILWKKVCSLGWGNLSHMKKKNIHKNLNMTGCEKSVGDNIDRTYNCYYAFDLSDVRDSKYVAVSSLGSHDIYDATGFGLDFQKGYEVVDGGLHAIGNCFTFLVHECNWMYYALNCFSCSHCFLCTNLRNKHYCILNKQYTKEEYEILVPKIIEHMRETGEWGEFFPASLSPFGYNETVASEYFPLSREEVLKNPLSHREGKPGEKNTQTFHHGPIFNWSDYEAPFPKVDRVIPASKLPEDISKIPDDILNWAIECEVTKKPFRIIPQELEFYRKHNLPIPKRHPDQRHLDRIAQRNPRKLYERLCDCPNCEANWRKIEKYTEKDFSLNQKTGKPSKKMITTYAPERPETVYCEVCYERDVVG